MSFPWLLLPANQGWGQTQGHRDGHWPDQENPNKALPNKSLTHSCSCWRTGSTGYLDRVQQMSLLKWFFLFFVFPSVSSSGIPWARESMFYREVMSTWNTRPSLPFKYTYPYPNLICISLLPSSLILHLFCFSLHSYPQQHRKDGCLLSGKHPGTTLNCSTCSPWH